MSEHTGTPWRNVCFQVYGADNSKIAHTGMGHLPPSRSTESEANAAFIVKAVNSHDALVKALTDARNALASLPMESLGYASDPMGQQIHWPIRDELLHRIDNALSASIKEPT